MTAPANTRRLEALAAFIGAYEREHGEISADEMRIAARRAGARAVTSRTLVKARSKSARKAKPR